MAKKKKKAPDKLQIWIDARKKYRLSHAQVQMARELGLNPRKFGGIANYKQEPWKEPLPQFIERLYLKRFGKTAPDHVISIEEHLAGDQRKKQEKRARKQAEASTVNDPPDKQEKATRTVLEQAEALSEEWVIG